MATLALHQLLVEYLLQDTTQSLCFEMRVASPTSRALHSSLDNLIGALATEDLLAFLMLTLGGKGHQTPADDALESVAAVVLIHELGLRDEARYLTGA